MAWDVVPSTRDMLRGDFGLEIAASAYYRGEFTVAELPVVGFDFTSTMTDGKIVRHEATLTVDDDEGRLVPYVGTDPLAPYGQRVGVQALLSVSGEADAVPVGWFTIATATATGSWRSYIGHTLPTGGTVTLRLQDSLQDLVESELPGLMQPLVAGTVASEIRRLARGFVGVDLSGLFADAAVAKSVVYEPSRLASILSLVKYGDADAVCRPSRDGVLEFFTLPTVATKQVTVAAREWVSASMDLDRDGIFNTVVTTSDQADSRISGMARETSGPFSADGPLGPRIYRHSSPYYTTPARANSGAASLLRMLQRGRSITVTAVCPIDVTVDCGDLHVVSLVPGELEPKARVTGVRWSWGSADMTLTYQIDRAEVETWTRPSDLQPA